MLPCWCAHCTSSPASAPSTELPAPCTQLPAPSTQRSTSFNLAMQAQQHQRSAQAMRSPECNRVAPMAPRLIYRARRARQRLAATATSDEPGPSTAFQPGQEAESRRAIFNNIAPVYDELNNRLSFGQHWVWKRMAVKWCGARSGQQALDVCCGSGDLAFLLADAVGPSGQATGLDFAAEMLSDAASKEARRQATRFSNEARSIKWVQGDAMDLPFPDRSFDCATMGYGLRNVADISKALSELYRVLRPGASVAILDFNNSTNPVADAFQGFMLENVVVPAARSYGLEGEYAYLRPSIKRFPTGPEQEQLARRAGFAKAVHYEISFGVMGVLVATKGTGRK